MDKFSYEANIHVFLHLQYNIRMKKNMDFILKYLKKKGNETMTEHYLKLGTMKNEELADWFGIALKTYKNSAKNYLEKLKKYADFERIRGGVNITKIHLKKYIKNYDIRNADYFNKEIERCNKEQDGLASISGIARKAMLEIEELSTYSERQVNSKFSDVALIHYGEYGSIDGGITGVREREWAIKLDDYNGYRSLTENEWNLFVEITGKLYSTEAEKVIKKKKLEKQLRKREIGIDEYFEKIDEQGLDSFPQVLVEFKAKTGFQIVLASKYLIKAWENE